MKAKTLMNVRRAIPFVLLAALGTILYMRASEPRKMPLLNPASTSKISPRPLRVSASREFAIRRVYGHSIVRGGVHSVEELKRVIVADPLAAQHYAAFDVTRAYVTRLPHDGFYFLSYQLNHKIYFTSALRLIPGGEEVLTDGQTFILTRCGNEIVNSAHGPVDPKEEPMDLDIVVAEAPAVTGLADGPSTSPASAAPPSESGTPPQSPTVASGGAPPSGGDGGPPPIYFPSLGGGSGTVSQISADDLSRSAEVVLISWGLVVILAWKFLPR